MTALLPPIRTDVLVIGAGPVGLYQAFQLGLLGLDAHVIDALPQVGGQCHALYADKPLYDIPAISNCTGAELAQKLLQQLAQIQAFAPLAQRLHLGQLVEEIAPQGDGRYWVSSTQGRRFDCAAIVIAAGVGAFVPRSLNIEGLAALADYVHHQPVDLVALQDQDVLIVGDDDTAVGWACSVAEQGAARSVVLNHRRESLNISAAMQARLEVQLKSSQLQFKPGVVQSLEEGAPTQGRPSLQAIHIMQADGSGLRLPCTRLGLLLGVSPKMGPISTWGLDMQRKQIAVDTARFATSQPGIFAVGDINHYAGKQKLIACGFHEATLAAHAALAYCYPERVGPLQYTTSSALLQQRLGKTAA